MSLRVVSLLDFEATRRLVQTMDEPSVHPPFRATGRKRLYRLELAGRPLFVKRYQARTFPGSLKELVRRSAGMQLWKITGAVEEAGIETPKRIAAGERRRGPFLEWTFFACEDIADAAPLVSLTTAAPAWETARRDRFAEALGRSFGALRAKGFVQPDLKPTNFLVRGDPAGEFRLLPIDLRQCAVGGLRGRWLDRKTERQLRARILEGWPPGSVERFFEAFRATARLPR